MGKEFGLIWTTVEFNNYNFSNRLVQFDIMKLNLVMQMLFDFNE